MGLIALAALLLATGQRLLEPTFASFILPMWLAAIGIVMTVSVTANGALAQLRRGRRRGDLLLRGKPDR